MIIEYLITLAGPWNEFADGFWYLDTLGYAASQGNKIHARQSFIAKHMALVDLDSGLPRPDYWSAVLHKRLMGTRVLSASSSNDNLIRVYAHCAKSGGGNITLILLNVHGSAVDVTLNLHGAREEYHLTAPGLNSPDVYLNGNKLSLDSGKLPPLTPVAGSGVLNMVGYSFAFVEVAAQVDTCK